MLGIRHASACSRDRVFREKARSSSDLEHLRYKRLLVATCFKSGKGYSEGRRQPICRAKKVFLTSDEYSYPTGFLGGQDTEFQGVSIAVTRGAASRKVTDDGAWQISTHSAVVNADIKTTITDTSSYDNLWINSSSTNECLSLIEIYRFDEDVFGNDDDAASLAVSDHLPVAISFETNADDDGEGDWSETNGTIVDDTRTYGDVQIHAGIRR
jgi:hypothetical protein